MNTAGAIPGKVTRHFPISVFYDDQNSTSLGFLGVQAVGYALHNDMSWSSIWRIVGAINLIGNLVYIFGGSGRRLG